MPDRAKRLRALLNDRAKAASDRALRDAARYPQTISMSGAVEPARHTAESAEPAAKKRW